MKKVYFLCPKCQKLLPRMFEAWKVEALHETRPVLTNIGKLEYVDTESKEIELIDSSHIYTKCPECGLISESYAAEEFAVLVDEEGNIRPYGEYWEIHGLPEDIDKEAVKD